MYDQTADDSTRDSIEHGLQRPLTCVEYCRAQSMRGIVLALPGRRRESHLKSLLDTEGVNGVVIGGDEQSQSVVFERRIGRFAADGHHWQLPVVVMRTIAFIGVRADISFFMIRDAFLSGAVWLVYAAPGRWRRELVVAFLLRRIWEKTTYVMQNASYRCSSAARRWVNNSPRLAKLVGRIKQPLYNLRVSQLLRSSSRPPTSAPFVADRIVLVNSSLAWGGAERQIVNTLCGLKSRGYADVAVICEHLHDRPDHDFYLWQLMQADVKVDVLRRPLGANCDATQLELIDYFDAALSRFPANLKHEIMYYGLEFAERRPSVVHAWQDSTSIKAGIAARLVGVPTIVLSGRNMAPVHFPYFLPYMKSAYKTLAEFPNVILINNSRAGADDYARWLQLADNRIQVVYNGLNELALTLAPPDTVAAYKAKLGMPVGSKVVGSIFRFYEEKDPLLWVRAAAALAERRSDTVFLLIGTGPMETQIRQAAHAAGITERLFMPGTEKNPAVALSAMDVFMLTSKMEGTPNVVIEAQLLGCPVVATEAGGTRDAILGERSGWMVSKRDERKLAERLDFVLSNADWSDHACHEARGFAQQRFGLQRMLDETLIAYGYAERSPRHEANGDSGVARG